MTSSVWVRWLVGLAILAGIGTASLLVSPSATFEVAERVAADPYLFGLLVAGLYVIRPLFAWPTTPLAVVVGYGFGVSLGIPIALVGVIGTVIPVFLAVRWFTDGSSTGEAEASVGVAAPIDAGLERTGSTVRRYYETAGPIRGVTASRLAPIPSDIATAAAAASGVKLRHLVIGTAVGELPWTVAAVVVGASAATIRTDGLGEFGIGFAVACTVAALLLLAGPAYRVVNGETYVAS